MTSNQRLVKEIIDRSLALLLLAATSPLFLLAAAWIKLFSRGPLLFGQQRVGLNERPFRIYKLRTMHVGSDSHHLGSVTTRRDPRLFFGARFLRKFKIDELPQLINVLNGTMSLVGPRPTVEVDYARMTADQRRRALVKPGLTGLAQINGAAALPWPRRIEFDLEYVDNFRLALDLKIIAATCLLVITGRSDLNPVDGDEWRSDPAVSESEPRKAA
jgi:lipopolysaccharide/colanic/teichoic acid biosynthesis glycosyltransferase